MPKADDCSSNPAKRNKPNERCTHADTGTFGEDLVADWLQAKGWQILAKRWRCRWGELDLVAAQATDGRLRAIAFVEVKTRRCGSWDAGGALAITAQKQAKLCKAAQMFLAQHPVWANLPCQFDVALVAVTGSQEKLVLQTYIPAAFTLE